MKELRVDAVERLEVLLLFADNVVLRAERDPGVDVAVLGVEVLRVHRRRQLRLPRRHHLLVEDVIPMAYPGEEGVLLDVVGAAGNDFTGFGKLQRSESLRLV